MLEPLHVMDEGGSTHSLNVCASQHIRIRGDTHSQTSLLEDNLALRSRNSPDQHSSSPSDQRAGEDFWMATIRFHAHLSVHWGGLILSDLRQPRWPNGRKEATGHGALDTFKEFQPA